MTTLATREAQAMACLEAADHHRAPLLALARKLTGCPEEGMNLYQQTLLNCHDAIQRNGFTGEHYSAYLFSSLRRLHWRQAQHAQREVSHDFQQAEAGSAGRDDEASAPWAAQVRRQQAAASLELPAAAAVDGLAALAASVQTELRASFGLFDRVALHLHAEGYSFQDIAEMVGVESRFYIRRRLDSVRHTLSKKFARAWRALHDAE